MSGFHGRDFNHILNCSSNLLCDFSLVDKISHSLSVLRSSTMFTVSGPPKVPRTVFNL